MRSAALFIAMLALWEAACSLSGIPSYLLPRPSEILREAVREPGYYVGHAAVTTTEAVAGLMLASCLGWGVATAFLMSDPLRLAWYPYAVSFQAIPVLAMAPLLTIWLGAGVLPKIAISCAVAFLPCLVGTLRGMESVAPDYVALFRSVGASRWATLARLQIPYAVPASLSAVRVSAALAVVGAVVAEFAGANAGLGYVILTASYRIETVRMFVALALCTLIAGTFFGALSLLGRYSRIRLRLP